MPGLIASAAKVFDTAISVTEARSRRASLQARAISASTAASAFGEWPVTGAALASVMTSTGCTRKGGKCNFTEFKKEFLNPSLYLGPGWVAKMANVSFNRKRVKLKQVLG